MDIKSLISLWNHTQQHPGTSGARACAGVLLGLYNGSRFPFDLTELRLLDKPLRDAALAVIGADASRCQQEVHVWLNYLSSRQDFSARFEWLASDYKCFKRGSMTLKALREEYSQRPRPMTLKAPERDVGSPGVIVDELHDNPGLLAGIKVVEDSRIPDGEARVKMGGKVVARILNLSYDQITEQGLRLTPEQAAAVKAMTDNFDADAHQRALNTPHFNDLAG